MVATFGMAVNGFPHTAALTFLLTLRGKATKIEIYLCCSSTLSPRRVANPLMDDSKKGMDMNDPAYKGSLTDPQAEIDEHLQAIRKIANRYKLPYFIVINHPGRDERWVTQMAAKVHKAGDAMGLFSTVDTLLMRASDGLLEVAPVRDSLEEEEQ